MVSLCHCQSNQTKRLQIQWDFLFQISGNLPFPCLDWVRALIVLVDGREREKLAYLQLAWQLIQPWQSPRYLFMIRTGMLELLSKNTADVQTDACQSDQTRKEGIESVSLVYIFYWLFEMWPDVITCENSACMHQKKAVCQRGISVGLKGRPVELQRGTVWRRALETVKQLTGDRCYKALVLWPYRRAMPPGEPLYVVTLVNRLVALPQPVQSLTRPGMHRGNW